MTKQSHTIALEVALLHQQEGGVTYDAKKSPIIGTHDEGQKVKRCYISDESGLRSIAGGTEAAWRINYEDHRTRALYNCIVCW